MNLLTACQMAYRKHGLGDDSLGYDEVNQALCNAICNEIGDEEFIQWLQSITKGGEQPNS